MDFMADYSDCTPSDGVCDAANGPHPFDNCDALMVAKLGVVMDPIGSIKTYKDSTDARTRQAAKCFGKCLEALEIRNTKYEARNNTE